MDEASRRAERFVLEILNPENTMAEAYKRAYDQHGLSDSDASSRANKTINQKNVRELLARRHRQQCDNLAITAERLEQELAAMAFSKITDAVTWGKGPLGDLQVQFKDSSEIPEHALASIKSIKISKDGNPEMTFHDKIKPLEMLGRRYRRFQEVTEQDRPKDPADRVRAMSTAEKLARLQELEEKRSELAG